MIQLPSEWWTPAAPVTHTPSAKPKGAAILHVDETTAIERTPAGAIRVLKSGAPGNALVCVAVLTEGEEYERYVKQLGGS